MAFGLDNIIQGRALTIAGSDTRSGAGIQADLATFADLGVVGTSVITALTAQNRQGVHHIEVASAESIRAQLQAIADDLPPSAIKIGMLADADVVRAVTDFLKQSGSQQNQHSGQQNQSSNQQNQSSRQQPPVVLDPVMTASAGGELLTAEALSALQALLPLLTLITPNTHELAMLTEMPVATDEEIRQAALALQKQGPANVLVTGGHREAGSGPGPEPDADSEIPGFSADYFLSASGEAFWLRSGWVNTQQNHGTGCVLSSAITAALAGNLDLRDALVIGKMLVRRGLRLAEERLIDREGLGDKQCGTDSVAHAPWQGELEDLPELIPDAPGLDLNQWQPAKLPRCETEPLGVYPVVDTVDWLEACLRNGVKTLQLRVKDASEETLRSSISEAVALQRQYQAQLFINDHWQLAIELGAYGIHLGQEDLDSADLAAIAKAGIRLGVSNHAWYEIARAHALKPSYMALGPVYATTTKQMTFEPLGLKQLQQWVDLLKPGYPLTAIGGIDQQRAPGVAATGVESIAVVRAITEAQDTAVAVQQLNQALDQGAKQALDRSLDKSQED